MNAEFFSHLTKGIAELLTDVLREEGSGLFRRSPSVVIGGTLTEASADYHLYFLGKEFLEKDQGSFTCPNADGSFSVFRNPVRMKASYLVLANGMLAQNRVRSYDRLLSFFFDNARLEPILPQSFQQFSGLYERLSSAKAEVSVRGDHSGPVAGAGLDTLRLVLDYEALYHSGTLLREESRVKTRVIEYNRNSTERSHL